MEREEHHGHAAPGHNPATSSLGSDDRPPLRGTGTAAALIKGESTTAIDEWLISPKFFVSTRDSTLRFRWLGNPNFASDVVATCEVRSKRRHSWLVVWGVSQESGGLAFEYPERTISLGPWLGDSVEVAFHAVGTNGADFGVDEIETGAFPMTRPTAE
jgi:hypothetical protein